MQKHMIEKTKATSELPLIGHGLIARLSETADMLAEMDAPPKAAPAADFMSRLLN